MLEKLRGSGLTPAHARKLHLEAMTEEQANQAMISPPAQGFRIPYFTPDGVVDGDFYRYRYLPYYKPSRGWASIGEPKKPLRYIQPAGSELHVYLPPLLPDNFTWRLVMKNPEIELDITEGELKAACGCVYERATLGLGGVFSWTSKTHQQPLIPILQEFTWSGRKVNLVFDSDRLTKPLVQLAASRLALALTARGAVVHDIFLPDGEDEKKMGLDDFILAKGAQAYYALFVDAPTVRSSLELHRLNEEVAMIWGGGAAGNIVRREDGRVMTPNQFTRSIYRDRTYLEYGVTASGAPAAPKLRYAAEEWLAWQYRQHVSQITYAPGEPVITSDSAYNLWRPPLVNPVRGDVGPWEDLLRKMFGTLPAEHLLWFKRWLAYPLQYPGTKLFNCALLWSHAGGTGKNLLAEMMIPLYGPHNCVTIKSRHLMSEFNSWAEARQFIIGDEITLDDKRHTSGDLKAMLTNRTIRINRKGIESYEMPDCANYLLTSNDPVAVVLDQGERRTFVHHVPERPLGHEYGDALMRWLYGYDGPPWMARPVEGAGAHALAWYLLNLPLGDFSPTAEPPDTPSKLEMISSGRNDLDSWAVAARLDPDRVLVTRDPKFSAAGAGGRTGCYAIYTPEDLLKIYDPEDRKRASLRALGIALDRAGFRKASSNNGRLNNVRVTFWLIKDPDPSRAPISSTLAARMYQQERPERFTPPSQQSGRAGRVQ